jgi:HEAT repeat protein
VLRLIGDRQLRSLRPVLGPYAQPGSELAPEALSALSALDGGLPEERVALLIGDPSPELRAVGVRSAPGTSSEDRLEPLLKSDPAPRVRAAAAEALLATRGEAAVVPVSAALFDPAAEVREAAVRGLASLGAAAVPTLEPLVDDRTAREASAPLAALALAGPSGRAALQRIAADHPDEQVRALARAMLGRTPRPAH